MFHRIFLRLIIKCINDIFHSTNFIKIIMRLRLPKILVICMKHKILEIMLKIGINQLKKSGICIVSSWLDKKNTMKLLH